MTSYVCFDLETTGLSPDKDEIIEIGAVKVVNGEIADRFSSFVNPQVPIPFNIEKLTGIKDALEGYIECINLKNEAVYFDFDPMNTF